MHESIRNEIFQCDLLTFIHKSHAILFCVNVCQPGFSQTQMSLNSKIISQKHHLTGIKMKKHQSPLPRHNHPCHNAFRMDITSTLGKSQPSGENAEPGGTLASVPAYV